MSGGSAPRSMEEIERLATFRQVVYRMAIIDALRVLNWRGCPSCREAKYLLEGVDSHQHDEPAPIPQPRTPDIQPGDMTMTTFDVACAFDVHPDTIGRWVRDGKLPHFLDERGRVRFDTAVIDALLD